MKKIPKLLLAIVVSLSCTTLPGTDVAAQTPLLFVPSQTSMVESVDYSAAPQLRSWCERVVGTLNAAYPTARKALGLPPTWQTNKFRIVLKKEESGKSFLAYTSGNVITFSTKFVQDNPYGACGAAVHEMAHVLQQYPSPQPGCDQVPGWWVEGAADYVRTFAPQGVNPDWCAKCAGSETYQSGYRCTAGFLQYLESRYPRARVVESVNNAMIAGQYSNTTISRLTGETWDQLWTDYTSAR